MLKEPFYKMAYRMVYGDSNRAILTRYNSDSFLLLWWFHKHLSYRSLMPFLRLRTQGGMGEDTPRLAGWIGLFFYKYKEKTIDRDAFKNHFQSVFTDERKGRLRLNADWQSCWEALEQCQEKKRRATTSMNFSCSLRKRLEQSGSSGQPDSRLLLPPSGDLQHPSGQRTGF